MAEVDEPLLLFFLCTFPYCLSSVTLSLGANSGALPTCGIGWPLNHRQTVPAGEIYLAATRIQQQTCPARRHKYQFKKLPYDMTAKW